MNGGSTYYGRHYSDNSTKVRYPEILMQSRTVVENLEYVATGLLTYAEGDIVEIELDEHQRFKLGEAVKITIYSPAGILVFSSTVIAKGYDSIMVLNSREISSKFGEERQYPRINVDASATISTSLTQYSEKGSTASPINTTCTIQNISLGGLGFLGPKEQWLKPDALIQMEIQLDFILSCTCTVKIIRDVAGDEFQYCGVQFTELPNNTIHTLRGFILKKQLDMYYENKQNGVINRS
jgi:c-di-GMP-binding flagellar brake protein YcgR